MSLSDIAHAPEAPSGASGLPDAVELVAQFGSEVAGLLSSALERVTSLGTDGRIDRAGLRALREEIEAARHAGITAQQIARLAGGGVALAQEQLDLTALLRDALRQRGREIEERGIELRQVLSASAVRGDPTLLFTLLQALLDWSFEHSVSRIDLTLIQGDWPAPARVVCGFAHQPPGAADSLVGLAAPSAQASLNTLSWRLLQQTAAVLRLPLVRRDSSGRTELTIDFPETLAPLPAVPVATQEAPPAPALAPLQHGGLQALSGRHVLVLAARREVRNAVRQALRPTGMLMDFVDSMEALREAFREQAPQLVVYESAMAGERFERLRNELLAAPAAPGFVRIAEDGRGFELVNAGGRPCASVARDDLFEALPEALRFELARRETLSLPAAA